MQKIKISTDSTADIPREIREELDIKVVPLTIVDGDRQYRDGYDLTPQEFYRILDESVVLPSSSQATPVQFMELYEETWKQGYTHLIHQHQFQGLLHLPERRAGQKLLFCGTP